MAEKAPAETAAIPEEDWRAPESFIEEAVRKIVEAFHPHKVILFGSYAYGRPTPDSDLDFLIIMDSKERWPKRYMAVDSLFWPHEYPMDFIVLTPQEAKKRLAGFDPFLKEIMEKGRTLHDADSQGS